MKRRDFTLVGTSIAGTVLLGCADDLGDADVDGGTGGDGTVGAGGDGTVGTGGAGTGGASSGGASSGGAGTGGASTGGASTGGASTGGASTGGDVGTGGEDDGTGGEDDGTGGEDDGTGGEEGGGDACGMIEVEIANNHNHAMTVTNEDIAAAIEKIYDITGTAPHPHMVTITAADFLLLASDGEITVTSSTDNGHPHDVTVTCEA